jgi:hypothetical protein
MKRIKLFILFLFFAGIATGQTRSMNGKCTIENSFNSQLTKVADNIGDFTITDSEGIIHNLYESLDAGKTVFIDLFFTT